MDLKNEIDKAAASNQRVTLKLASGEMINGVAEVTTDPKRAKVRTLEGPVWVPYGEVEHVSRVINLFH